MRFEYQIAGRAVTVYRGDTTDAGCPVIYLNTFESGEGEAVSVLLADIRLALVCVVTPDWNGELSPWPAPRAFASGEDFTGGADAYLKLLTEEIVPEAEARLNIVPSQRYLTGYSLAGLFALYAVTKTALFDGFGSMSGSLWYDGFTDYLARHKTLCSANRGYLSLGDREAITKNPRMAKVLDCTRQAEGLLKANGMEMLFELNHGNHYADVPARLARGIRWLAEGK
jgi:predicted alpha/beta superfamily hydrolase